MGVGFRPIPELGKNHRFIRGNHDSPELCRSHPNWISDSSFDGKHFFLGGAWSIDQEHRIPGVSWWHDEELSVVELNAAIDSYETIKPSIVVSHDGPESITTALFLQDPRLPRFKTRTGQALETMFNIHQPKLWIFGHWHKYRNVTVHGTTFICLGELDHIDIDVDEI